MIVNITSRENGNVKEVTRLIKEKRYRDKCKSFVVEGLRLCVDALINNVNIHKVFYTEKFYHKFKNEAQSIINKASGGVYSVSDDIMRYMSDTDTPQGIMCVCKYVDKFYKLNKIEDSMNVIALENIQNPSNLGTILRTCDAMGVDAVILTEETCDVYNSKVIRGSMGSVFHLPIVYEARTDKAIKVLKDYGFSTYAMVLSDEAIPIQNISKLSGKKVLFIGNEGNGLGDEAKSECTAQVTIPMKGKSESLNAAIAASIAIWETTGRGI